MCNVCAKGGENLDSNSWFEDGGTAHPYFTPTGTLSPAYSELKMKKRLFVGARCYGAF